MTIEPNQAPLIYYIPEVTSTLDVAHRLAEEDRFPVWASVLSRRQTAGRGQMRREWHSPEGNIYCAIRLPEQPPFDGLAAAPALGAYIAQSLTELGFSVRLKWPNDIIVPTGGGFGKAGGILLEQRRCLIAGIGINLAVCPSAESLREGALLPAASLLQDGTLPEMAPYFADLSAEGAVAAEWLDGSGRRFPRWNASDSSVSAEKNWFALYECLVHAVKLCYEKNGIACGAEAWRPIAERFLAFSGRRARVEEALLTDGCDADVSGIISGIGPNGELLLDTPDGIKGIMGGSLRILD